MDPSEVIILASLSLVLSYVSPFLSEKTRIPDVVWLIVLGIIVGPVLEVFSREDFVGLSHLMSIVALSVILFDAGLDVDINTFLNETGKATGLAFTTILTVTPIVGIVINYLRPESFTLLQGMLLGSMIAGTSTVSIYGCLTYLSENLKNIEQTKALLIIESVLSDPTCIILSNFFIKMVMNPNISVFSSFSSLITVFIFSIISGLLFGMLWAIFLTPIRNTSYSYMVTLAINMTLYVFAERIIGQGGGAIISIAFSLALSNFDFFANLVKYERDVFVPLEEIEKFHGATTFFVKSFFFVYIGLIVNLSIQYAVIGVFMVVLLMVIRYIVVTVISKVMSFTEKEEMLSKVIYASGLPAFVMSQLPRIYDPKGEYFSNPSIYTNLAMPIVLGIIIFNALALCFLASGDLENNKTIKSYKLSQINRKNMALFLENL